MIAAYYFLIVYKKVEDSGGQWRLTSTTNHLYIKRLYYEWRIFPYFQTFGIFLFSAIIHVIKYAPTFKTTFHSYGIYVL